MRQNNVPTLTTLQLIVGAMMTGLVTFAVIVLAVGTVGEPDPSLANLLLAVLGVLGVSELAGYVVLRMVLLGKLRGEAESTSAPHEVDQKVLGTWSTLVLIRSAMTEGWGLFGCVIALVTGSPLGLAAAVLAVLLLAMGFPTQGRLAQVALDATGQNPYATPLAGQDRRDAAPPRSTRS